MKIFNKKRIILASQSPRRKELLEQTGIIFDIIPSTIDETMVNEKDPGTLVKTLSRLKAVDVAENHPDTWVLGADTIVCLDNLILEKPHSRTHAEKMLNSLSGREHTVFTGFHICSVKQNKNISDIVETRVSFKTLSNREIQWYLNTREYADKAGAYAIQGRGAFFIKKIHGSYTNVVGLPLCEVIECLTLEKIIELK